MSVFLDISVNPRFQYSSSRKLTTVFVEERRVANPSVSVIVRDLVKPIFRLLTCLGSEGLYATRAAFGRKRGGHQGDG